MDLYEPDGTFSVPNQNTLFDPLPDGRLIATDGTTVWLETAAGSRTFTPIGTFPVPTLAGFVRVSPGGRRAALTSSDGKKVLIFDPLRVAVERTFEPGTSLSFDSEWIDDTTLAVTLAETGQGTLLKFFDADTGTQKTVLRNLGDASGGVTFDRASGLLYAGIGFLSDTDPAVGLIKAFPESQWSNPPAGGIDFEAAGTPVANFLSAAFLGFDKFGNLYVGGGDAFGTGDMDYAAVVHKRAVDAALLGGPVTDPTSPADNWQRFDPDPATNDSWFVNANQATGKLYLKYRESARVNVYRPTTYGAGRGVLWRGCFQLGDNAHYYPDATYVGLAAEFPILFTVASAGSRGARITVQAREVQTLAGDGHWVEVIGFKNQGGWQEVPLGNGRLKTLPGRPITVCNVDVDLSGLGNAPFKVAVRVRMDTSLAPGLYDDIILTELSVNAPTLNAKLGFV